MKTTDIAFTRKHLIFGTVTLVFILLVSCSKNSYYPSNTNSIEVTLESWNTDIDYLTSLSKLPKKTEGITFTLEK